VILIEDLIDNFNRKLIDKIVIGGKPRDTSRNFPRLNYFKAQVLFRKICHTLQKSGDHLFCGPKKCHSFYLQKARLKDLLAKAKTSTPTATQSSLQIKIELPRSL